MFLEIDPFRYIEAAVHVEKLSVVTLLAQLTYLFIETLQDILV